MDFRLLHLFFATACAQQPLVAQDRRLWGYSDMVYNRTAGVAFRNGSAVHAMALHLTAEKAAALRGSRIVGIRTAFGTRLVDSLQVFASATPDGAPLASATFAGVSTALQDYLFGTPVTVTGTELFVGYTFHCKDTLHRPMLFDLKSDFPSGVVYALTDNGWTDVTRTGHGAPILQLILENAPADYHDVVLKDCSLAGTLKQGGDYTLTCHVTNLGFAPVNALEAASGIGNTATQRHAVSGLDIAPGTMAEISVNGQVGDVAGQVQLRMSVESVDGTADADPTDNGHEESRWVFAPGEHRRILLEKYTGQGCNWCALGDVVIEGARHDHDYVVVAHHTYGHDAFAMRESYTLSDFFGIRLYPSFVVDRQPFTDDSAVVGSTNGLVDDLAEATRRAEQRPVDVNVGLHNSFDPLTRQGELTVSIHTLRTPSEAPHTLSLWLTQDSISAYQTGQGNDYPHCHTYRGMLTDDVWGLPVALRAGETIVRTFSYSIPESIVSSAADGYSFAAVPEQMHLVAFVSDVTESSLTSIVHNAAEVRVTDTGDATSIPRQPLAQAAVPVLDADGRLSISGTYVTARIYAADGHQECMLSPGQSVRLPHGLHVLLVDGTSYKIICR